MSTMKFYNSSRKEFFVKVTENTHKQSTVKVQNCASWRGTMNNVHGNWWSFGDILDSI